MKGKLVIISGPSGAGKDTLLAQFLKQHSNWVQPASTTTRHPRSHHVDGKTMNFISLDEFNKLKKDGAFLESVEVYDGIWYGTLREPVEAALKAGKNVILRVDVRGAMRIKQQLPEAKLVFITTGDWASLEERIRSRGTEDEQAIQRRLDRAKRELEFQDKYDRVVINRFGKIDEAVADLAVAIET